ncbi:hypothetical protein BO95DRAFT_483565 [Aspergillus brunneoviolaceus CBS 621.78]|uniref:Uncharacterized protein n=1 Tax=Aspergillus brunneoviolaceus CBS 621.78 TaxID=1450534 RepID=A0ACD1G461_9EURO|nr:hypothetical protein BO95DRAFT_483565 [Aspergillus brunneoviolaceus CBS 621.78]RAH44040.1 hypothetical protein BO95DRAFT_483565 [Aspergillus brunneoviolaceus CBS 621.78]
MTKTYNRRDSLVVTHPTTNLPACGLSTAERTGSPIFHTLWSVLKSVGHLRADANISSPHALETRLSSEWPMPEPAESTAKPLAIVYGPEEVCDAKIYAYCYSPLEKEEKIHWTNENFGGDTWVGGAKTGTIYYATDGGSKVEQCMGRENQRTEWEV